MPAPCDCRPLSRKPVFSRNRAIRCNPASTVKPGSRSGRSHDTAYPPIDEIRRKERQPAYVPVGNPPRPVFRKALADVSVSADLNDATCGPPRCRSAEHGHPTGRKRPSPPGRKRQESIGTVVIEQDVALGAIGSPRRRARSDASPAVTFLAGKHDLYVRIKAMSLQRNLRRKAQRRAGHVRKASSPEIS